MGDRAHIAVKQPTKKDPDAKVYLYTHWGGNGVYTAIQRALKGDGKGRLHDSSYLTRILAREMGIASKGETGYGISLEAHTDIEHVIPVLDCETQTITFEDAQWEHNKNPAVRDRKYTFDEFVELPESTFQEW